jgi:hypothetical protein
MTVFVWCGRNTHSHLRVTGTKMVMLFTLRGGEEASATGELIVVTRLVWCLAGEEKNEGGGGLWL